MPDTITTPDAFDLAAALRGRLLAPGRFLSVGQVGKMLGVCQRTVWRWVARGLFPEPVRYSRRIVRWRAEDVADYLSAVEGGRHVPA
jgi:predicted DNA-binding transcriptional regulator AlpA